MELTLVILAAGIGRRYGGFKQMEPMGPSGEFIIDYSIHDAVRAGFKRIVFVITNDIEDDFRSTIGARVEKHVPVSYVCQKVSDVPDVASGLFIVVLRPIGTEEGSFGAIVRGRVRTHIQRNVLQIPQDAVATDGGRSFCWHVQSGQVARQAVQLGVSNGAYVEVQSGLAEGAQVVVAGGDALEDGDRVRLHAIQGEE